MDKLQIIKYRFKKNAQAKIIANYTLLYPSSIATLELEIFVLSSKDQNSSLSPQCFLSEKNIFFTSSIFKWQHQVLLFLFKLVNLV